MLLDVGVIADRDNALALDRQRLGNRESIINGDDLAVQQHGIRQRLRWRSFAADHGHSTNENDR